MNHTDGGGHRRRPKDEWGSIAAPLWCPGIGPHFVCRAMPFRSSCRSVLFDAPCRFVCRAAAFCLWRHTAPVIVQPRFVGAMPFRSSWRPLVLWRHSVSFAAHPDMAVRSEHGKAIRTWQSDSNMAKRFGHGKCDSGMAVRHLQGPVVLTIHRCTASPGRAPVCRRHFAEVPKDTETHEA